jgi:hypothetical protein
MNIVPDIKLKPIGRKVKANFCIGIKKIDM